MRAAARSSSGARSPDRRELVLERLGGAGDRADRRGDRGDRAGGGRDRTARRRRRRRALQHVAHGVGEQHQRRCDVRPMASDGHSMSSGAGVDVGEAVVQHAAPGGDGRGRRGPGSPGRPGSRSRCRATIADWMMIGRADDGEDVPRDDAAVAQPRDAGGVDVQLVADAAHRHVHEAEERRRQDDAEDRHRDPHRRADHRPRGEQHDDRRAGPSPGRRPTRRRCRTSRRSSRRSGRRSRRSRARPPAASNAAGEADLGRREQPREHVASGAVAAEQVLGARRGEHVLRARPCSGRAARASGRRSRRARRRR